MRIKEFNEADWRKINECVEIMTQNFTQKAKFMTRQLNTGISEVARCIRVLCLMLLLYGLYILPDTMLTFKSLKIRLNQGKVLNMVPTKFLKPFSIVDKDNFLLHCIRGIEKTKDNATTDKMFDFVSTLEESTLFFLFKYAVTTDAIQPVRDHQPKGEDTPYLPIQPMRASMNNYETDMKYVRENNLAYTERPVTDKFNSKVDAYQNPLRAVVYTDGKKSNDLMLSQYAYYQDQLDRAYNKLTHFDDITFHIDKIRCNPGVTGKTFHKKSCLTQYQVFQLYSIFIGEDQNKKHYTTPHSTKDMYNHLVEYNPKCHNEQCLFEKIMNNSIVLQKDIYSIYAPVHQLAENAIHSQKDSLSTHKINMNDVENVLNQYVELDRKSAYYSIQSHDESRENIDLAKFDFKYQSVRKFVIGVFDGDSIAGIYIDFDKAIIFYYDPDGASVIFPSVLKQIDRFLNAHPKFTYYINPYCQYHVRKDNQAYVINFLVNMLHGSEDIHKKIYKFQVTGVDENQVMSDRDNVWFNKPSKAMIDGLDNGVEHLTTHTGDSFSISRTPKKTIQGGIQSRRRSGKRNTKRNNRKNKRKRTVSRKTF